MISVEISNEQDTHLIGTDRLVAAATLVLEKCAPPEAWVSLAVVDDPTMHDLNRQYLDHDYPTDVLSFVLEQEEGKLIGEVIVSSDTAAKEAGRFGWSVDDELLLYVTHGVLHLVGFDDTTDAARREMREQERRFLTHWNLSPRYDDSHGEGPATASGASQQTSEQGDCEQ